MRKGIYGNAMIK